MEREVAWCNAENYVLSATYRLAAVTRSETGASLCLSGVSFPTLNPKNATRVGWTRLRAISPVLEYYQRSQQSQRN